MDPRMDLFIKRTTWVCTGVVAWLAVTADYGPQENVQTSLKNSLHILKEWFWTPSEKELEEIQRRKRLLSEHKENKEP